MNGPAPNEEHFRKLERMYAAAPINRFYQPSLTVGQGVAEVTLAIRPDMHHAARAVHGSVYFKALDDAAYFAVNSIVEDVCVLTTSFDIHLLRPIALGEMRARARVVHGAGRRFIADAELRDRGGVPLARGSGTFVRSKIPLSAEIGYE